MRYCPGAKPLLHGDVAGDLHHPGLMGMRCHPSNMHFPGAKVDKEQRNTSRARRVSDLGGEEVGRYEDVHVCTDKLLPRSRLLAFEAGERPWRLRMLPTVWSLMV